MKKTIRLLALIAVLALVGAACGTDDDSAQAPVGATDQTLPPTSGDEPAPDPAGTCLEGEPDCNDTPGGTPSDLPPPKDTDLPAPPPAADALSVSEALNATGPVTIMGALFIDDSGARICEALAESFPPQCGGASVAIVEYEELLAVPTVSSQGITWTDQVVSFPGEIVDGVFVVDPFAQ